MNEEIFNHFPGGNLILEKNNTLKINYISQGFCRLVGLDEATIMAIAGDDLSKAVVSEDRATFKALFEQEKMAGIFRLKFTDYCCWVYLNCVLEGNYYYATFNDASAMKEQQEVLLKNQQRLKMILKHTNLQVWDYNLDNRTFELMQNKPQIKILPNHLERLQEMYQIVEDGIDYIEDEISCFKDDNQLEILKISLSAIRDESSRISSIMGLAENITEQKKTVSRLEEEIFKRSSLETTLLAKGYYNLTNDLILEYDISRLGQNQFKNLFSYSNAVDVIVSNIPDIKYQQLFRQEFSLAALKARYTQNKTTFTLEYPRYIERMKHPYWVKTKVSILEHPDTGDLVAFMFTYDISVEKLTQDVLENVIDQTFDDVVCIDIVSGYYHSYGQEKFTFLGQKELSYSEAMIDACQQLINDPAILIELLPLMKLENVLLQLKERAYYELTFNVEKDNHVLTKKIQYSYLNENKATILMTWLDVTEVVNEERKQRDLLETALVAAKQASSAKSDFLSRMSHEIRTPMNAIIGMTALAAQAIGNDEEVADCLSKIGISARFLLSLINDILDMSRIESGKILLRNERFPFEEFINGINTIIYSQTASRGIDYENVVDSNLCEAYIGDAMKLQQVVINVLGNAVKFTNKGGKITFMVQQVSCINGIDTVRFVINDTGCGIHEDFLDRIFEPFEQQDDTMTSMYGGTGLGLAISKNLVQLMGGTIKVRSIVGVGSEFCIEVPLQEDKEIRQRLEKQRYDLEKLHTLVVDDDVVVCESAIKTLKDIGMLAKWVTSGREAIDDVSKQWHLNRKYDFILIDWKMPDMDGIETTRQIRKIVGDDVTIIIITAYDWVPIEQAAKEAGANMLVSKPLFKTSLISAFQKALGQESEKKKEYSIEYDFHDRVILVAEDHPLNAEITTRLLEKKGCKVEIAVNGLKALEMFTGHPVGYYDLILMDVRMPLMDGLQATSNIRHWNKADAKTIPIIAMTANAFDEDIEKSKLAGMNAHLAKPIDPQVMYHTIYRLING